MIISPEGSYIVISSESADCYFTAFKDKGPNSRHIMQGLLLFFFGGGKIIMVKYLQVMFLLPIFVMLKRIPMPTIFILFGFRFLFYANDHEPIHVHVVKGEICAKFTLFPVQMVENHGLKPAELKNGRSGH
ncbi:DUF4160 domain-containing protein [Alistipes sp. CHKCI003]|uniref:DUF4160 domain-containing protein n=2 Tax=Alistipes TaxID=239759 RepID=UPI002936DB2C|nr:DUF4160 domain-containing protein [Alistipes sp. CHKCI003]